MEWTVTAIRQTDFEDDNNFDILEKSDNSGSLVRDIMKGINHVEFADPELSKYRAFSEVLAGYAIKTTNVSTFERIADLSLYSIDELQNYHKTGDSNSTLLSAESQLYPKRQVCVEMLEEALRQCEWSESVILESNPKCNEYPSVANVSRAYSLNMKQHQAFCVIATACLRTWQHHSLNGDNETKKYSIPDTKQLIMYLGGLGGSGKSRVIKSTQALFSKWDRSHLVSVVAPTGSAAVVVQGSTVQSFLGMCHGNDDSDDIHKSEFTKISKQMRDKLKAMTLLIIDEVSMIQP